MSQKLLNKLNQLRPFFQKGGKYENLWNVYEAHETLFFQPNHTAPAKGAHIRDANDMKRLMVTVILALVPAMLFGMWNVGREHYTNITTGVDAGFWSYIGFGAWKFLPLLIVCYAVGLTIEFTFATLRNHPVSEGFLVSGMLIPLVVPSTLPLWQMAIATAFAVIIGKEVFGGTGMNILNVALTARAFLFFAYPGQISGDAVWVDLGSNGIPIDSYTGATNLAYAATTGSANLDSFSDMFFGFIPGSIGETSTLACALGAGILILTGVGSWRIMLSMVIGALAMGLLIETTSSGPWGEVPFYYQIVMGGFAFGTVFMATDPVSAASTNIGKVIYGFLAGVLSILIRVVNPAYPEGVMLAILLMNVFAPLIDYYVVAANKRKRLQRAAV